MILLCVAKKKSPQTGFMDTNVQCFSPSRTDLNPVELWDVVEQFVKLQKLGNAFVSTWISISCRV